MRMCTAPEKHNHKMIAFSTLESTNSGFFVEEILDVFLGMTYVPWQEADTCLKGFATSWSNCPGLSSGFFRLIVLFLQLRIIGCVCLDGIKSCNLFRERQHASDPF